MKNTALVLTIAAATGAAARAEEVGNAHSPTKELIERQQPGGIEVPKMKVGFIFPQGAEVLEGSQNPAKNVLDEVKDALGKKGIALQFSDNKTLADKGRSLSEGTLYFNFGATASL